MTIAELKADIERQQQTVLDQEWLLEQTLAWEEAPNGPGDSSEAYDARARQAALANAQVAKLLESIPFGDLATHRLNYLLSVAQLYIHVWHHRRQLSLYAHELAVLEDA